MFVLCILIIAVLLQMLAKHKPCFLCFDPVPYEWSWQSISPKDANLWEAKFGMKIAPGIYTSRIFNQHMSKWCGCCYMVSVLQCIQDKMNIALGIESPDTTAQPYIELNYQIALDAYNSHRQKKYPDWNACKGGNPVAVIECIRDGIVPLVVTSSDGFAWFGHPNDYIGHASDLQVSGARIAVENKLNHIQSQIFKFGPLVLGINSNCMNDAGISRRNGLIDTSVSGKRNHAVVVVGWKEVDGQGCWVVRNTWGTSTAPSRLPNELNCVTKGRNVCQIETINWYGDPHNHGYVYVPFNYQSIQGTPSPWYFVCPNVLTSLHTKSR